MRPVAASSLMPDGREALLFSLAMKFRELQAYRKDTLVQPDVPKRSQHCRNIAVRQAAFDGHGATVTDERLLAGEPLLDDGEQIIGKVGDIGDSLVLDLSVLAKRSPKVSRNVNLAFIGLFDFCNMHGAFVWLTHDGFAAAKKTMSRKIPDISGYKCNLKDACF